MGTKIFLAGASGVIGRSLVPQLVAAGHEVVGTTRTHEGKAKLEQLGIRAVQVDVFDRDAITKAVYDATPRCSSISSPIFRPDPILAHRMRLRAAMRGFAGKAAAISFTPLERQVLDG